jgi:predicted nucleic acid-binding protein
MKTLCADACYLIALYDHADSNHSSATRSFAELFDRTPNQLVILWPILYETLSTRMARRLDRLKQIARDFERLRSRNQIGLVDDVPFRDRSFSEMFQETARPSHRYRPLSLADRVVRNMLVSRRVKVDALLTFNVRDFEDVCRKRQIEIAPN